MKNILIIGNGLAGMSAAIRVAERSSHAIIIAPDFPTRSESVMACGGINAALNTKGEDDSPKQHAEDTMKSGCYLADPDAVSDLANAAPTLVEGLGKRGVVFSRDSQGNIDLRSFGGQKKMRTAFSKSGIGKQLVAGISSELRRYEAKGGVTFMNYRRFVSPIFVSGRCAGAIIEDIRTGNLETIKGDGIIAASGGMGGLFSNHTGSTLSDGSVTASLFVHGAETANLEMIQYHPTTIQTKTKNILISEAARGEGGRLFTIRDGKRWYFMEDWYPEGGNLMPRDVVSRSIYKVCFEGLGINGRNVVGLELETLPRDVVYDKLKEVSDVAKTYLGIDAGKEYIPVYPAIHYFMGGLYVDRCHRTTLQGVYAAGECACQYHGANRLGGNSTLGAIYGGRVAAETAVSEAVATSDEDFREAARVALDEVKDRLSLHRMITPEVVALKRLNELMSDRLGIIRDEKTLSAGIDELSRFVPFDVYAPKLHAADAVLFEDKLILARAILESARARKESRGAHTRSDYPETSQEFSKVTVASCSDRNVSIRFDEIGRVFA